MFPPFFPPPAFSTGVDLTCTKSWKKLAKKRLNIRRKPNNRKGWRLVWLFLIVAGLPTFKFPLPPGQTRWILKAQVEADLVTLYRDCVLSCL